MIIPIRAVQKKHRGRQFDMPALEEAVPYILVYKPSFLIWTSF